MHALLSLRVGHQMRDKRLVLANAIAKATFRQDIGEASRILFYLLSQLIDEDAPMSPALTW